MDNLTTTTKAELLEQLNSVRDQRDEAIKERDTSRRFAKYSIDDLIKERDAGTLECDRLRRELCQVIGSYHGEDAITIAGERGWNCFENCTQVGGEWLVNEGKA